MTQIKVDYAERLMAIATFEAEQLSIGNGVIELNAVAPAPLGLIKLLICAID